MRVALIYATWPVTPFGVTWHKFADSLHAAGLGNALTSAGYRVEEYVLTATGPQAGEFRGAFELGGAIAARCREAVAAGALPVVICGSCTVASLGVVSGLNGARTGIIWMDAHPDLNTPETSGSGLLDGMALAAVLGKCWTHMAQDIAGLRPAAAEDVCLFGARDIDPGEALFIADHGIPIILDARDAINRLAACDRLYLHLDMDVHDPIRLRVSGFAVPGGPTPEAVRDTLRQAARARPVAALSVTSLDPAAPDGARAIACAIEHIQAVCDSQRAA